MNFKSFVFITFLIGFTYTSTGENLSNNRLSINQGLSNNYIHTLHCDKNGFIWIGTETGLDSYDGAQIKNYAKRFKSPLKGAVQSVLETDKQVILVGTSWGAFRYDIAQNKSETIKFGTSSIDVREIFCTSGNDIYFTTNQGLFLSTKQKTIKRELPVLYAKEQLIGVKEAPNKKCFLIGENHIFQINNNSISPVWEATGSIKCSFLVGSNLYIGTSSGVFCLNLSNQKSSILEATKSLVATSITYSHNGDLYIGTSNDGIYKIRIRDGRIENYRHIPGVPESVVSNSIMSLLIDKNENLWIGTFDGGLDYINLNNHPKFTTYELLGNSNTHIRSLYYDSNGVGYCGTRDGILFSFDQNKKIIRKLTSFPSRSQIFTTIFPHPTKPDWLLVGTFGGGIFQINKNTLQATDFSQDIAFKNSSVYKFCTDNNKTLWIATLNGVIRYNLSNNTYSKLNTEVITGSNEAFTISFNGKNKIWIGTKTGICRFNLATNKLEYPGAISKYKYQCTSIYQDSHQNTWCCFNKGGVLKITPNDHVASWFTTEIGIPENAPSSVIEDKKGNIWIGSSKGLFKINSKNDIETYSYEDGLNGLGFCPESATTDPTGNIWWTNDRGLVTYTGFTTNKTATKTSIYLTDIYINGTRHDADTLASINTNSLCRITIHGKSNNNLELRVIAPNYKYPLKSRYAYKINDSGNEWIKTGNNNLISLNNLSAGSHHLLVKATDEEGNWIDKPLDVNIIIQPYFYESIWFTVLLVISGLSLVLYFTRNYTHRMRIKLNEQLEDLRKKQTKPAEPAALKISEQRAEDIKTELNNYMITQKPFLSAELRQADVAKATGFAVHEISQVLNSHLNVSFPDYINSFRVEEIKERMKSDDARKYTLTAIAVQCGFSGKSSFLRAFRKATGQTPSEFFKGIQVD